MGTYAAVVLAGGAARRMGGVDKPARPVGGLSMRDRVLAAVGDAAPRVLVGPGDGVADGVRVTREDPPGGGPVAAMAAGLALLDPDTTLVAVLAADLPLLTRAAIGDLLTHLAPAGSSSPVTTGGGPSQAGTGPSQAGTGPSQAGTGPSQAGTGPSQAGTGPSQAGTGPSQAGTGPVGLERRIDGVCFVDADGRRQSLCGVWRVAALRTGLARLAAERGGSLAGAPVRGLWAGLAVREVPWVGDGPPPWFDCDTDEDVRRAEEWVR
ncbi:NTP transferase domain-containing protein [Micromonospora lupini]|uniref:molybdenum cofactor guanylyltransferase n=1 Tax=Micromonospora lupini TaxID=285679 RepID=UPI002250FFB2|nr:NTP transferase domain-containing protein [Micromonospora lupini]MCX5068306.1 NTP transferase domain-containing protein [Micromonospora lupini]